MGGNRIDRGFFTRQEEGAIGLYFEEPEKAYLNYAGAVSMLTLEQELGLGIRIQLGIKAKEVIASSGNGAVLPEWRALVEDGFTARAELAEAYMLLVVSIANEYKDNATFEEFFDLVHAGNMGMMKAAEKYLPEKKVKFGTYAKPWIKKTILLALSSQSGTCKTGIAEKVGKMDRYRRKILQTFGREPTLEEYAVELGVEPRTVLEYQQDKVGMYHMSLNQPMDEGGNESEWGDFLEDQDASWIEDLVSAKDENDVILEIVREWALDTEVGDGVELKMARAVVSTLLESVEIYEVEDFAELKLRLCEQLGIKSLPAFNNYLRVARKSLLTIIEARFGYRIGTQKRKKS